jgi:hypothetical protein
MSALDKRVRVQVDIDIGDRGFRKQLDGYMIWKDDKVALIDLFACYLYHPDAPEEGRWVPPMPRICVDLANVREGPEGLPAIPARAQEVAS